ncbi:efflux RND transporter periplasmic adaptor subunit [Luteolibacter pohnpeiensis]|uniref:Efflux RND transporter periplasmic adaptor subunit n=1 Tax=Luteolibacter pohnpeiensis TaxID=454153 RepID=A0A934VWE1_9BACT|nr:efflux RND transporter periplasmic adaptor subunit [Luteolibacter pohnpeiensis]MBK1882728.1 efflux RND transporter periplasmic adaptor subunit [Luteolibacter pohnpeiensis]
MSDLFSNHLSDFSPSGFTPRAGVFRRMTWLLPAGILLGFVLIFLLLFRDQLLPSPEVKIAPALLLEEALQNTKSTPVSGKMLFQASGWIEPDPLPVKATALQDGVIDEVHVLEGQSVKKGDLLATLVAIDTQLECDTAKAELQMAESNYQAHCTGTLVRIQELEAEKAGLVADQADLDEALDQLKRIETTSSANYGEGQRVAARLNKTRKEAAIGERKARIDAISEDFNRIAYEATAMEAKVNAAKAALAKAELAHQRTRILSPIDGRVLRLMAAPGQKKMLGMDEVDSATIAILYQPEHLQVRVDVPLADASGLSVGQMANIRCNLLPDQIFHGEVTRITGEADLQRNTLQAKVRIEAPDDKLRPEMLCRVEFLEAGSRETKASSNLSIYIPREALQPDNSAWIYDPASQRVERRSVIPADETREGYQRIREGIRAGERVVLNPENLRSGQRVHPTSDPS